MLIYQGIVTTILAALLLNTINNRRLLRRPPVLPAPDDGPLVSILIPRAQRSACDRALCRVAGAARLTPLRDPLAGR
jgi:hypothetical protein